MKTLNKNQKKEIEEKLNRFGIKKLPYLLFQTGKEKIRGFSGSLSREEIEALHKLIYIESIGLYLAKFQGQELRLSFDSPHLLKNQINKNILELSKEQAEEYMKGKDLILDKELKQKIKSENISGFIILKYKEDLLGCGKLSEDKISNYVPKERRIKE